MSGLSNIHYLRQADIDKKKWDHCIENSPNRLIYGYSWYLDAMAAHWDALVSGDYKVVMPLPWNRKFCIPYIYQPFLTAQLGIFAHGTAQFDELSFINTIPRKFLRIDLPFNEGNCGLLPARHFITRSNYVLNLGLPYEQLFINYRDNTRRNIRKSQQQGCIVVKDPGVEKVIELARSLMVSYGPGPQENIDRFRKLYGLLKDRNMATTYGVSLNGVLAASCVFFFLHDRAYYILVGNHPQSKASGVSHTLIDAFIRDHAGKKIFLDFEGSDISSLAFFYSGFGAEKRVYPALHVRTL